MFVGILLRDLAHDFRVVFRELAPSEVKYCVKSRKPEIKSAENICF